MIDGELGQSERSPARAILLQSPGREPWVNPRNTFIEPCKGGTFPTNAKPQTKCSRRKCRSYGAQSTFVCVYPGLHFGLCRSVVPTALTSAPPNKRKSLGRKSLGFEKVCRPYWAFIELLWSEMFKSRQGLHLRPTLPSQLQCMRTCQECQEAYSAQNTQPLAVRSASA